MSKQETNDRTNNNKIILIISKFSFNKASWNTSKTFQIKIQYTKLDVTSHKIKKKTETLASKICTNDQSLYKNIRVYKIVGKKLGVDCSYKARSHQ